MTDGPATSPAPAVEPGVPPAESPSVLVTVASVALGPPLKFLAAFGEHMMLLGRALAWIVRPPFRPKLFVEQMEFVGVGSLPIVTLVGFFTGAVSALQTVSALKLFQQERWVGFTVGVSLAQELAPVFTALMITARAGSGMATELGSMRITEQIDSLTTFAVNPIQYLVTPRIVATILVMPLMTMVFNVIGLCGGYVVAIVMSHVDFGQASELYRYWTDPKDYYMGLIKSAVFGLALALTACYQGFNVRGGAKEVGRATTRAVVYGSVSVLVLDYFLIEILSLIWPFGGG